METEQQDQCSICTADYQPNYNGEYCRPLLLEPPVHAFSCNAIVGGKGCGKRHDDPTHRGNHLYDQRLQMAADQIATKSATQLKKMLKTFNDCGGCFADVEVADVL